MYSMNIDGVRLYNPNFADYHVEKPLLKLSANKLATLTFTIYDTNPSFDLIQKLKSVIVIYRDGDVISMVRPVKSKMNMRGGVDWTCEDCLARLNDVLRRPSYFKGTKAEYLSAMLSGWAEQYNKQIDVSDLGSRDLRNGLRGEDVRQLQAALMKLGYDLGSYGADGIFGNLTERAVKAFQSDEGLAVDGVFGSDDLTALRNRLGDLTPEESITTKIDIVMGSTPHSDSEEVEFINDDYVGYWDLLQKNLIEPYGGYLVPVWTEGNNDTVTLSYMGDEDLPECGQSIEFGKNLSSLFVESDSQDTFSVLIPLGADVRFSGRQSTKQAENTPLTIASVNGGDDYLESEDGLALYGRKEVTMRWDDIKNASDLKDKGLEYLAEHAVQLKEKVTLSAIDLSYLDVSIDHLSFLTSVDVKSLRHNLIETYPLTELTLSLGQPNASKLTLGSERETLTDRMKRATIMANGEYSRLSSRVFGLENA